MVNSGLLSNFKYTRALWRVAVWPTIHPQTTLLLVQS